MTSNDYQAFASFMRVVSKVTVLPNGKSVDEMIDAMFLMLADYSFEVVKEAVMRHCKANKFFPMLADVVCQIEHTPDERALMAWGLVLKARREYRIRVSIRFPHPAIHFALEQMGGWEHVYNTLTDENEDFKCKTFSEYYKLGEKYATWDNVCDYFFSEAERYALNAGRVLPRKVYDVSTDALVPENQLSPIEPLQAWATVRMRMLIPQWRRDKFFEDPAITYAVEKMGGFSELCATLNEGTELKKLKEFRAYYMKYGTPELPA
ncbi:MAG: hypothetical protein IJS39_07290 [Synergistaceae bacterium]|nr:hypothetical protein [Synergistaceae bacterium]